jgi:hypothetical protein
MTSAYYREKRLPNGETITFDRRKGLLRQFIVTIIRPNGTTKGVHFLETYERADREFTDYQREVAPPTLASALLRRITR